MNKNTVTAIIGLTVIIVFGYFYFQYSVRENFPGENKYRIANKYLEDGDYQKSLDVFIEADSRNPDNKLIYLGKGLALMQLGRFDESKETFDSALSVDEKFATGYANRGILLDRMGRYEEALKDYRKALEIRPDLAEGPGWLWRFLRNITEKPPTIADRADYIEAELKKPENERLLSAPQIDAQQRMYNK